MCRFFKGEAFVCEDNGLYAFPASLDCSAIDSELIKSCVPALIEHAASLRSRSGGGFVFLRVVEVAAALMIVCFGALLLTGYLVEERMLGA